MAIPRFEYIGKFITEFTPPVRFNTCRNKLGTHSSYQLRIDNLKSYVCRSTKKSSSINPGSINFMTSFVFSKEATQLYIIQYPLIDGIYILVKFSHRHLPL